MFRGAATNTATGQITATAADGVGVQFNAGGGLVNEAGGQIIATYGVVMKGDSSSITNAGTIDGTFDSVIFAGAANTLTLKSGSSLVAAAVGSQAAGATNALVLQGGGATNNRFFFFNTLDKRGSGSWRLDGISMGRRRSRAAQGVGDAAAQDRQADHHRRSRQ